MLTTPVKFSVIYHTEIKEDILEKIRYGNFYIPMKQVTWQKAYAESDLNAKCYVFLDVLFIIMTLFSQDNTSE